MVNVVKISNAFSFSVKFIATVSLVSAMIFQFVGQISRETFLGEFGISGSFFEKNLYRTQIDGFLIVMNWITKILPSNAVQSKFLIVLAVLSLIIGFVVVKSNSYSRGVNRRKMMYLSNLMDRSLSVCVFRWLDYLSKSFKSAVLFFVTVMMLVPAPMLIIVGILFPSVLLGFGASLDGKSKAQKALSFYQETSVVVEGKDYIAAKWVRGKDVEVFSGYVIDMSEKFVALYDVSKKRVLILELRDARLEISAGRG